MPRDFRNRKFQKVLRGYADTEVDSYIAYINEEYRKLERAKNECDRKLSLAVQKINAMTNEMAEQSRSLAELTGILPGRAEAMRQTEEERMLRDEETKRQHAQAVQLLKEAEEKNAQAEKALEEASKTAEAILAQAHAEADQSRTDVENARRTARALYGEVCAFRNTLFGIYNTHIESVETIAGEAESFILTAEGDAASDDESEEASATAEEAAEEIEDIPEEIPELPEELPELPEELPEPKVEITSGGDLLVELPEEDLYEADKELAAELWEEEGFTELADEPEEPEEREEESEEPEEPEEVAVPIPEEMDFEQDGSGDDVQSYNLSELIRLSREGKTAEEKTADGKKNAKEKMSDFDELLSHASDDKNGSGLEDAFHEIYGGSGHKNVEEIRRQPTVVPEEPKNPKKHKKF